MLERSPDWRETDGQGMRAWMSAYLEWLRTSDIGKQERGARNNHGTWYDAQVAALALFTGDSGLARATLEASRAKRIGSQVKPDGSQPFELVRTRALAYSAMNLEGLCRRAELGRLVGVALCSYAAPDGGSIRKALDYVAPYVDGATHWPGSKSRRSSRIGPCCCSSAPASRTGSRATARCCGRFRETWSYPTGRGCFTRTPIRRRSDHFASRSTTR